MTEEVHLRDVTQEDIPIFFEHQLDAEALRMAAFPSRDWDTFAAHWTRILDDGTVLARTIVSGGRVAGNIVSFERSGAREVGYWLGRECWGKGVATQALSQFLRLVGARPLHARVATGNLASIRVLEKCGFTTVGRERGSPGAQCMEIEEVIMRLG